jgi:CheY-like chemotaxis protein
MPVLDGIKTAKKVQEMIDNKEINENIKIIFVSGNIDGENLKNSLLQMDCVKECLQKPVRIDKYQKIIDDIKTKEMEKQKSIYKIYSQTTKGEN